MLYQAALPLAEKLYITRIHHSFPDTDTFFPEINPEEWKVTDVENHSADKSHPYDYTFLTSIKKSAKR